MTAQTTSGCSCSQSSPRWCRTRQVSLVKDVLLLCRTCSRSAPSRPVLFSIRERTPRALLPAPIVKHCFWSVEPSHPAQRSKCSTPARCVRPASSRLCFCAGNVCGRTAPYATDVLRDLCCVRYYSPRDVCAVRRPRWSPDGGHTSLRWGEGGGRTRLSKKWAGEPSFARPARGSPPSRFGATLRAAASAAWEGEPARWASAPLPAAARFEGSWKELQDARVARG